MASMNFMAGGGQGDDVLSQVDSMIEGRIGVGGSHSQGSGPPGSHTPGLSLTQILADGVRDLLGGERARRHRRENDLFRGTTRQPQDQVIPPVDPAQSALSTNPDGSPRSPSQQLLDGLMTNFGAMQ